MDENVGHQYKYPDIVRAPKSFSNSLFSRFIADCPAPVTLLLSVHSIVIHIIIVIHCYAYYHALVLCPAVIRVLLWSRLKLCIFQYFVKIILWSNVYPTRIQLAGEYLQHKIYPCRMSSGHWLSTVSYLRCCIGVLIPRWQFTFSGLPGLIKDIRQSPADSQPSGLITPGNFCNYCKERVKRYRIFVTQLHFEAWYFTLNWRDWQMLVGWDCAVSAGHFLNTLDSFS